MEKLKEKVNPKNEEEIDKTIMQEKNEAKKSRNLIEIIRIIIQSIFQTRGFVVLVGIFLLLKTVLLYKIAIFNTKPLEYENIHMAAVFIFVFMVPPMLLKDKTRFWITLVEDLLISLLLFAQEEVDKLNYYLDCLQKELDISLSTNILNLLKK